MFFSYRGLVKPQWWQQHPRVSGTLHCLLQWNCAVLKPGKLKRCYSTVFQALSVCVILHPWRPYRCPSLDIGPGNHSTSPRSSSSWERGSVTFRRTAVLGGGKPRVKPAMLWRTNAEAGPLTRTTATPHLPCPDDRAKMVSASCIPLQHKFFVKLNLFRKKIRKRSGVLRDHEVP